MRKAERLLIALSRASDAANEADTDNGGGSNESAVDDFNSALLDAVRFGHALSLKDNTPAATSHDEGTGSERRHRASEAVRTVCHGSPISRKGEG